MLNSLRSNSSSLFRISLLLLIFFAVRSYIMNALLIIYLMLRKRESVVLYIILLSVILFLDSFRIDPIPVGIIEYRKGSHYIVDRILYKSKIKADDECLPGDILIFDGDHEICTSRSDLRYNIRYIEYSYERAGFFPLRRMISEKIASFPPETGSHLYGFLYSSYSEDGFTDITYGLASYYLLKQLRKRSSMLCLITLFALSVCFSVQIKYVFIIIDLVCGWLDLDRFCKTSLYILSILFINTALLENCSIVIPLVISVYSLFETGLGFANLLMMIQSLFFGEIDLFSSLFFSGFIFLRIFLYLFSVILLGFPGFDKAYLFIVSLYSRIDDFCISIRGSPSFHTSIIFISFLLFFRPRKEWVISLVMICLLLSPLNRPFAHVSFIDVGQGDAIMIKDAYRHSCILIDTGSSYNYAKLRKFLYSEGIYALDHLIITHDDADHNGNIASLYEDFRIGEVVSEGKDIKYGGLLFRYCDLGRFDDDNDNSLVYSLNIEGSEFLFTGDISKDAERVFIRKYGPYDCDVLKVSHHGSNTSSSSYFIGSIMPGYAVISTSGQYSHPHKEVTETIERYGVRYFNTRYDGTVSFYFTRYLRFILTGNSEFVIIS